MKKNQFFGFAIILAAFVSCSPENEGTLKLGLMPAVNSIPFLVADANGYFKDEKADVELVMFTNQVYREAALQSGEIDGSVSDMINAVGEWKSGLPMKVTSLTEGRFALLSSPSSSILTMEDLKTTDRATLPSGLLQNSIVYYATERMFAIAGADVGRIDLIPTPQIPARLEMLLAGRLELACLPEPMTRVATAAGAHLLMETDVLPEPPGVLLFIEKALTEKERTIRAVYRAYDRAVNDLGKNPEAYRDLIIAKGQFPPAARDSMVIPAFSKAALPSEAVFQDVVGWMKGKGLIETAPGYADIVDRRFLQGK